jgi:glycosyltransferase involved in cell wall biosynthesis
MISVVLPVRNEEIVLKANVAFLHRFLTDNFKEPWRIIIVSNGSSDATNIIGRELSNSLSYVFFLNISEPGKGRAVRYGWEAFSADLYTFMDIDLATNILALPKLLSLLKQGADLVYGSRFHVQAKVRCSLFRRVLSYGYGAIFRILLHSKIQDPACGFKGVSSRIIKEVVPRVKDQKWFFDSELLVLAEKLEYRPKPLPVQWSETNNPLRKSKVPLSLVSTYIKALWRLRKDLKQEKILNKE